MKKQRFDPVITRIKLNPEQAVLACACWRGNQGTANATRSGLTLCRARVRVSMTRYCGRRVNAAIS